MLVQLNMRVGSLFLYKTVKKWENHKSFPLSLDVDQSWPFIVPFVNFVSLSGWYKRWSCVNLVIIAVMTDICIARSMSVTPRQEAVQCDGCNKWQHRTCNTGISRADYRTAVQSGADLDWLCFQCSLVPCTSTLMEELSYWIGASCLIGGAMS